jgi:hypothetical protein
MAKAKRKTLPKDFDAVLKSGDLAAQQAVFDTCELDARGGYAKGTALAFHACSDALARWLVESGADLEARDIYGRTALHDRASSLYGDVGVFLDLGADVHVQDNNGATPLHHAAGFANLDAVRRLLERGARVDVPDGAGLTPLAAGLQRCSNAQIAAMAKAAELLLAAEPPRRQGLGGLLKRALGGKSGDQGPVTPQMQAFVRRIGENFEFHRQGFNPDFLEETSAGLDRLYALFDVAPAPRRVMHDGGKPIVARSARWQDQHQELWEMLVPSRGAASTVQGEVIRIAGKVADEVDRNGAANWDADHRRMLRAFLAHVGSGAPLPDADRERAAQLAAQVRDLDGAGAGLCELAVAWVRLNPTPVPLATPDYAR